MAHAVDFGVRIVDIDYEMCAPMNNLDICLSAYSGNELCRVPVIRIFGILNNQRHDKCCVHVHRVFPYFLVPFHPHDKALFATLSEEEVNLYLTSFASQIEDIMRSEHPSHNKKKELFQSVSVVFARDFYGFQRAEEPFIELCLVEPRDVRRVCAIVGSGAVNGCAFPAFEAHIPFVLRFLVDWNLFGMNLVRFARALFRQPVPRRLAVPAHLRSSKRVRRRSLCQVELDIVCDSIRNAQWMSRARLDDADADSDLAQCQLVPSLRSIWAWERQRRAQLDLTVTDNLTQLFSPKMKRFKVPSNRVAKRHADVLDKVLRRIERERPSPQSPPASPSQFSSQRTYAMYGDDASSLSVIESAEASQLNRSRRFVLSQSQLHSDNVSVLTQNDDELLDILDELQHDEQSDAASSGKVSQMTSIPEQAGDLTAVLAVLYAF